MSEISILSQKSSSLYNSSVKGAKADPEEYIYSMPRSSVIKFFDKFHRSPVNNADFGATSSVTIPSYGVIKRLILKTRIKYVIATAPGTPLIGRALYARVVKKAELAVSSRVLLTLHDDMIQYLYYQMGEDGKAYKLAGVENALCGGKAQAPFNLAAGNTSVTHARSVIGTHFIDCYTVLPFSCFEMGGAGHPTKSLLNGRFLEKMQLNITFGDETNCIAPAIAANQTTTIDSCELLTDFDIIDQPSLDMIEKANFSTAQPLAQVFSDFVKITQPHTSTATTVNTANNTKITCNIFNTELLHSMIVCARQIPTAAGNIATALDVSDKLVVNQAPVVSGFSRVGSDLLALQTLKLSSSGRVLYEAKNLVEGLLLGNNHHSKWWDDSAGGLATKDETAKSRDPSEWVEMQDPNTCSNTNFYVIPFANNPNVTNGINGALACKNLNSIQVEAEMKTTNAKNYELMVYLRFYKAIATESRSGRLQVSVSN